jgi:hypothetical protein
MSSDKRLAPGLRHVDAFDSDDIYERDKDGEIIEDISYVTLDLGPVEPSLVPSSSSYRLIVRRDSPTFIALSFLVRVGFRHANPISSALRDDFPGYTPITARHRASLHRGQRLVSLIHRSA